jgi:hypothetical protein
MAQITEIELTQIYETLIASKLWHNGDSWRNSEQEHHRVAWLKQRESLQSAIETVYTHIRKNYESN